MKCVLQLSKTYFDFICMNKHWDLVRNGEVINPFLIQFFFFNIKKSKGHIQKINVFIIDDHLGKIFKAMNDTILRENFIVSMMFGLHNFTFITFY